MYQYDPSEGRLQTAFRLRHTVIPHTLGRIEFWLFFGLQVGLYLVYRVGILKHIPGFENTSRAQKLDWGEVKITCAFTVFFEVFYTNVCYHRYVDFYAKSRTLFLDLLLVVFDLRIHLKNSHPLHTRLAYRYFLCSLNMFWEQVNEMRQVESLKESNAHFKKMLMTEEEESFLERIHPEHRFMVVLHWSMDVFILAHGDAKLPANVGKMVLDKMQKGYYLMCGLLDELYFPIPFPYFHLLNLMVCVNLILLAICMGLAGSHLEVVVYFIADLIFLGMMELAAQLEDPFGEDEVDFPVAYWLRSFFQRAELILEYQYDHGSHTDQWKSMLQQHESPFLLNHELDAVQVEPTRWEWVQSFFGGGPQNESVDSSEAYTQMPLMASSTA